MGCIQSTLEQIEPNPDIIRMTEAVIAQNKMILEMNARLLATFQALPVLITPAP